MHHVTMGEMVERDYGDLLLIAEDFANHIIDAISDNKSLSEHMKLFTRMEVCKQILAKSLIGLNFEHKVEVLEEVRDDSFELSDELESYIEHIPENIFEKTPPPSRKTKKEKELSEIQKLVNYTRLRVGLFSDYAEVAGWLGALADLDEFSEHRYELKEAEATIIGLYQDARHLHAEIKRISERLSEGMHATITNKES